MEMDIVFNRSTLCHPYCRVDCWISVLVSKRGRVDSFDSQTKVEQCGSIRFGTGGNARTIVKY